MAQLSSGVIILIAILLAAAVVAIAAAMHKVYRGRNRVEDTEAADAMVMNISNEQQRYMRDVRLRGQLQAWGVAPAYEDVYEAPRSHLGGGTTTHTSYG